MRRIVFFTLLFMSFNFAGCEPKRVVDRKLLGQNNSVWAESIYFRGYNPTTKQPLTDEMVIDYAKKLKKHQIKYAYIFAGPFSSEGFLPEYGFSATAINSVKLLKTHYPDLVVLPWIGGIQNKTVHLQDSNWVRNALADTKRLIKTLGVSGAHIDFEYLVVDEPIFKHQNNNRISPAQVYGRNVNRFLEELRAELPEAFLSSVVVSTSPDTRPWKRKTNIAELEDMIKYIDQLSFLYYDTQIDDQETFSYNCLKLLEDVRKLKSLSQIQYLIAIGTFVNEPELQKYRDLNIENNKNTLTTIKENLVKVSSTEKIVDGIAIYCDWETDEWEWAEFMENWVI